MKKGGKYRDKKIYKAIHDKKKTIQCIYYGNGYCKKADNECPYGHFMLADGGVRVFNQKRTYRRNVSRSRSKSKENESSDDGLESVSSRSESRESRVRSNSESSKDLSLNLSNPPENKESNAAKIPTTPSSLEEFMAYDSEKEKSSTSRLSNGASRISKQSNRRLSRRSSPSRLIRKSRSKSRKRPTKRSISKSPSGASAEGDFVLCKDNLNNAKISSNRKRSISSFSSSTIRDSNDKESERGSKITKFIDHRRPSRLTNEQIRKLREEFDKHLSDFSLLGDFCYGTWTKLDVYKWQKEILMYQLYLPANSKVRQNFSISDENLVYPSFDEMQNANFDLNKFNKSVFDKIKKWNELEFAEQYIQNSEFDNYRTDDLRLEDGSLFDNFELRKRKVNLENFSGLMNLDLNDLNRYNEEPLIELPTLSQNNDLK